MLLSVPSTVAEAYPPDSDRVSLLPIVSTLAVAPTVMSLSLPLAVSVPVEATVAATLLPFTIAEDAVPVSVNQPPLR